MCCGLQCLALREVIGIMREVIGSMTSMYRRQVHAIRNGYHTGPYLGQAILSLGGVSIAV